MRIELISTKTGETRMFTIMRGRRAKDIMDKVKAVCDEMEGEVDIFYGTWFNMELVSSMQRLEERVKEDLR